MYRMTFNLSYKEVSSLESCIEKYCSCFPDSEAKLSQKVRANELWPNMRFESDTFNVYKEGRHLRVLGQISEQLRDVVSPNNREDGIT